MVSQPQVKPAGYFWGYVLGRMGFDAVYAPNGRIYIACLQSTGRRLARRSWLIEHEMAHHYQRCRDGYLRFWAGICWAYVRHGHANSPYEIEANEIADMAVGW